MPGTVLTICSKGIKTVDMLFNFKWFFSLKITALHCVYFRLFPIQFFARIPKGMGSGERGGGYSLSFDVPGRGGAARPIWAHSDIKKKRGRGRGAKIGHFSWMS